MILRVDNQVISNAMPLFTGQDIVIGIDASKTNTGIAVGDLSKNVLHWIELNGADDGTSEYDALNLCKTHRDTLKVLLQGSNVVQVGIEDIITKITKDRRTGMTEHSSRFKITCIFSSLISFFQDNFNITPMLINNQSWKAAVLPEQFRSRDIGKGSLAYFRSIGSKFGSCTDDVTDAVCILQYVYQKMDIDLGIRIREAEVSMKKHNILLVSDLEDFNPNHKEFMYNPDLTIEQNAAVMSNRTEYFAKAKVNVEDLQLSAIYKYCTGKFNKQEQKINLWVLNESR